MFENLFQANRATKPRKIVMETDELDMTSIPRHIAIIMDGNGRWAKARGKVRTYGHKVGAETLKTIVRAANDLGVKVSPPMLFRRKTGSGPLRKYILLWNC